jgi:hypothetical protein
MAVAKRTGSSLISLLLFSVVSEREMSHVIILNDTANTNKIRQKLQGNHVL